MARILITGGAGFIGSHLADELLHNGHTVKVFDLLCSQVHGAEKQSPEYLNPDVELVLGDVRDRAAVQRALQGIDAVYHFAAAVGVGQSMYEVEHYASINDIGTAVLLEALIKRPVERLIVASSMSVYGEGLYRSRRGAIHCAVERSPTQLRSARWDPLDDEGAALEPIPTPETKTPALSSVYALSKYVQERHVSDDRPRLQYSHRRPAFFQRVRTATGAIQSVYRCAGDFRLSFAQRQSAADL